MIDEEHARRKDDQTHELSGEQIVAERTHERPEHSETRPVPASRTGAETSPADDARKANITTSTDTSPADQQASHPSG